MARLHRLFFSHLIFPSVNRDVGGQLVRAHCPPRPEPPQRKLLKRANAPLDPGSRAAVQTPRASPSVPTTQIISPAVSTVKIPNTQFPMDNL